MRIGCFAVLACAVSTASVARADVDIGKADAAFDEGQKAKDAGDLERACQKFHESLTWNPNAVGTMLNVAQCDEDAGHIGTALKLYTEARDRGQEQNMGPYVHLAEQHIQKIGADVPYLNLVLVENTRDTKVVVNDQVVAIKDDGTASLPVDPGLISIIVSRPDRVPFEKKIDIKKQAHETVRVDPLHRAVTINRGRRRVGQILTIGGGAVALGGVIIGLVARSQWNDAIKHCSQQPGMPYLCPDITRPDGSDSQKYYSKSNAAYDLANVGTAVGIGGLVIAGIGGYLWFFGPHDERLTFAPRLDPEHAGIVALGRF